MDPNTGFGSPPTPHINPSDGLDEVLILHPRHPYTGQRGQVLRVRRNPDGTQDLIVRFPDGLCGAIAPAWTDYEQNPLSLNTPADPFPLLDLTALRQLARLLKQRPILALDTPPLSPATSLATEDPLPNE